MSRRIGAILSVAGTVLLAGSLPAQSAPLMPNALVAKAVAANANALEVRFGGWGGWRGGWGGWRGGWGGWGWGWGAGALAGAALGAAIAAPYYYGGYYPYYYAAPYPYYYGYPSYYAGYYRPYGYHPYLGPRYWAYP